MLKLENLQDDETTQIRQIIVTPPKLCSPSNAVYIFEGVF